MADFTGVIVPSGPVELGTFDSKVGVEVSPPTEGLEQVIIRRALVSGTYVYFTGATPPGATDVVIISEACV